MSPQRFCFTKRCHLFHREASRTLGRSRMAPSFLESATVFLHNLRGKLARWPECLALSATTVDDKRASLWLTRSQVTQEANSGLLLTLACLFLRHRLSLKTVVPATVASSLSQEETLTAKQLFTGRCVFVKSLKCSQQDLSSREYHKEAFWIVTPPLAQH